ncbi:MAG: ATP-dependent DNA helicase RecQ [Ginsengibacter sp.]
MTENLQQILKQYWGYDSFRSMQEDIITSILEGNDTLAILPTGGGKSICFQVPALALPGICLVISPLVALMKDQVENLKRLGINALSLNSAMGFVELKKTLQNAAYGNYKFLYVSPERLESDLFLEYLPLLNINIIAVDEAHCVSQWGYDFRPPYLRISTIRELLKNPTPVLALTASATKEIQDDICNQLHFGGKQKRFQKSFERANLSYSIFNLASKQNKLLEICAKVPGSGIVYCKTRKRTKEIAELLQMNSMNAGFYHAGLPHEMRMMRQESWIKSETRIMVCTNAFGMGIDKSDVRFVVHYDVPDALENYYQEAGRAGRDEKKAYAVLLYLDNEIKELKKQTELKYPPLAEIKNVYKSLANYFQLAAGGGEGISFDFEIADFIKKFKLGSISTLNAIKALAQENLISYSEQFYKPATAFFTTTKAELESFEISHADLSPIIKGLLRTHEGIFDYPAFLNISQLAAFINLNENDVLASLQTLKSFGLIDYNPQKDKPQIIFLHNRSVVADLKIETANLNKRKKAYEGRLNAMINFIEKKNRCRSQLIGNYFNDFSIKPCGICDSCLNQKNLIISAEEFDRIRNDLLDVIYKKPLAIHQLFLDLKHFKANKLWKVLDFLQNEEKIKIYPDGSVSKSE